VAARRREAALANRGAARTAAVDPAEAGKAAADRVWTDGIALAIPFSIRTDADVTAYAQRQIE